jgi:uncharacterized membrane protein
MQSDHADAGLCTLSPTKQLSSFSLNTTSISCPQCNAEMPGNAAFCPGCGRRMIAVPAGMAGTGFHNENILAALAYFTFIPAVVFLNVKSLRHNRLLQFHSWQSIFFDLALILAALALRILFALFSLIPRLGYLLGWLAFLIAGLACAIVWVVLVVKALQGELFKLPMIGDFAEKA